MIAFIVAILLFLVFLIPFLPLGGRTVDVDPLAPSRTAGAFHILTIVPFLLLTAVNEETVHWQVRFHRSVPDLDTAIVWYGVVQALAFIAIMIGVSSRYPEVLVRRVPVYAGRFTQRRALLAASTAIVIGMGAFIYLLDQIGGYAFLLANIYRRAQLLSGLGYAYSLLSLLSFGVLVLVYSLRSGIRPMAVTLAVASTLTAAVVYSSFGGRRSTIVLLISVLLVWHYGVRRVRRIKMLGAAILLIAVPYMIAVPIIRTPDGFERFTRDPGALWTAMYENVDLAVRHVSYVDQYILITSHFTPRKIWLGASYGDLLTAPIPSSILPNKPPVDDGTYVRTLADGREVKPPRPARELNPTAWPPETLGATYMNFWLPGVLIGMFLLGVVYKISYLYMRRSGYTLFSILIYGYVILNFQLSNLRIVSMLMYVVILSAFFGVFFGLFRRFHAPPALPGRAAPSAPSTMAP